MNRTLSLVLVAVIMLVPTGAIADQGEAPSADTAAHATLLEPEQLVRDVLAANRNIKAGDADVRASKAGIVSAGSLDDPMLTYQSAPATISAPMGYSDIVSVSQAFPWPGVLHLRKQAASNIADKAQFALDDTRLRLAAKARALYAEWYYVAKALAINAEDLALVDHIRTVALTAYASGAAPQQDVFRAEIEHLRLQNLSEELKRRQSVVRAQLNELLDAQSDSPLPPPGVLPEPPLDQPLSALTSAALAHNPALARSGSDIAANQDLVQLAKDAFLPNFNVMAGRNGLMSPWQSQYTLGVGINIPISARHRGDLDVADARLNASRQNYDSMRDQIYSDINQSWAAIRQLKVTISIYDLHLISVTKLDLKASEEDYRNGRGDFTRLIDAETQYLTTELERERARADYFTQYAALNYQTGGALIVSDQEGITP